MQWYPFDLTDGQTLSLEVDIGGSQVEGPEILICRFDGDSEPIIHDIAENGGEAQFVDGQVTFSDRVYVTSNTVNCTAQRFTMFGVPQARLVE